MYVLVRCVWYVVCSLLQWTSHMHGGREGGTAVVSHLLRVEEDRGAGRVVRVVMHRGRSNERALLENP